MILSDRVCTCGCLCRHHHDAKGQYWRAPSLICPLHARTDRSLIKEKKR